MGTTNVLVLLGGLLFGGGGVTAFLTWRTQSRSSSRADNVADRRVALEEAEGTNKILAAALDWYKAELDDERARHAADVAEHRQHLADLERRHDAPPGP